MHKKRVAQTNPEQEREAFALKQCLDYLEGVAEDAGLYLSAHLISLASEAAMDSVQPRKDEIISKKTNGGTEPAATRRSDRKPQQYRSQKNRARKLASLGME